MGDDMARVNQLYLKVNIDERVIHMAETELFEIVETRYKPTKVIKKLDFLGSLPDAKAMAKAEAQKNIGVRYGVFPQYGSYAASQFYFRTTVTCPKCGTIIPIE